MTEGDFRLWHLTDMPTALRDVRSQGQRIELFRFLTHFETRPNHRLMPVCVPFLTPSGRNLL
jgi:hypothetical protein